MFGLEGLLGSRGPIGLESWCPLVINLHIESSTYHLNEGQYLKRLDAVEYLRSQSYQMTHSDWESCTEAYNKSYVMFLLAI